MRREQRRHERLPVDEHITVVDAMTGQVLGRIGNLSESGMLLLSNAELQDDALYQVRFELSGHGMAAAAMELGLHLLWQDRDPATEMGWAGLRMIAVPASQLQQLRQWISLHG